jgi:aminomethyltransferase
MQTELSTTLETEYRAAQNGCVLIDSSDRGRLRLTGSTRLDFVHRLSSNDVAKLSIGQGAATLFLTPIGRLIDRTLIYMRENDLMMLTSRGTALRVMAWLKKYIFFNDDVQLKDVTGSGGMLSLFGSKSLDLIQSLVEVRQDFGVEALRQRPLGLAGHDSQLNPAKASTPLSLMSLPLHHWQSVQLKETEVLVARADPIGHVGFHLMIESAKLPKLRSILIEAGATSISEETYQVLRVEAGQPEFGRELIDDTIPLEANLWDDVSFTKGCYTGQEIIARMESRQRLAKQLVGLRLTTEISLPAKISVEDAEVGNVTSVVHSSVHGWLGLGYLKPTFAIEEQSARVGDHAIEAQVSLLPFKF